MYLQKSPEYLPKSHMYIRKRAVLEDIQKRVAFMIKKETAMHLKRDLRKKALYIHKKDTAYIRKRSLHSVIAKEPYQNTYKSSMPSRSRRRLPSTAKELSISAKELYISAKETYIFYPRKSCIRRHTRDDRGGGCHALQKDLYIRKKDLYIVSMNFQKSRTQRHTKEACPHGRGGDCHATQV